MIRSSLAVWALPMLAFALLQCPVAVGDNGQPASLESQLSEKIDLAGQRSPESQHYRMATTIVTYAPNGEVTGQDTYRLLLKCIPASQSGQDFDLYTCGRFRIKQGENEETHIPALDGWSYEFRHDVPIDEKGHVFGIDHGKFEGLVDSAGATLPPDKAYHIYNTFIDFHAFCNVFAEPTLEGGGIQDLSRFGQRIVHDSAFSEPPVELGSNVGEGSVFKNGEVTLALKGLSVVDQATCALVGFDSGQSSFKMFLEPIPGMKISTTGGSHYQGNLYIDLRSRWVRKVEMSEFVVSETKLPMPPNQITAVHERKSIIRSIDAGEFAQRKD